MVDNVQKTCARSSQPKSQRRGHEGEHVSPPVAEGLVAIDGCWEREGREHCNNMTSGRLPTQQNQSQSQDKLGNKLHLLAKQEKSKRSNLKIVKEGIEGWRG